MDYTTHLHNSNERILYHTSMCFIDYTEKLLNQSTPAVLQ